MAEPPPAQLRRVFEQRPVVWVGAGLSRQAFPPLPTLWGLVEALKAEMKWEPDRQIDDPYKIIDEFLRKRVGTKGDLQAFLAKQIRPGGVDPQPGAVHRELAALALERRFTAVIDTNYDLVLRSALGQAGVPYRFSAMSRNLMVAIDSDELRYMALHGTTDDWSTVVLDGESYRHYDDRHPLAIAQLELLLHQRPVVFLGCSLQDPRLIGWFGSRTGEQNQRLRTWIAVLGPNGEQVLAESRISDGRSYREVLDHIQILELPSFDALPAWIHGCRPRDSAARSESDESVADPVPMERRPDEQRLLDAAREFVTRMRQEARAVPDLEQSLKHARTLTETAGADEAVIDDDARRLLADAAQLMTWFLQLDREIYDEVCRLARLNIPQLQSRGIHSTLVYAAEHGSCNYYEFENAARVFHAVREICMVRGERLSDELVPHAPQPSVPSSATMLFIGLRDEGVQLAAISADGSNKVLGSYKARAHGIRSPWLCGSATDELRIYARDHSSVYRWNVSEHQPEAEWRIGRPIDLLYAADTGPIEFALEDARMLFVKWRTSRQVEPTGFHIPARPRHVEFDGEVTRVYTIKTNTEEPLQLSIDEWSRSEGLVKATLDISDAILTRLPLERGRPVEYLGPYCVKPARYQGFECVLVCSTSRPGTVVSFVDVRTGHALRAAVHSPTDLKDVAIVTSSSRTYLLGIGSHRGVHVFDLTARSPVQTLSPHEEASGLFIASDRVIVTFVAPETAVVTELNLTRDQPSLSEIATLPVTAIAGAVFR